MRLLAFLPVAVGGVCDVDVAWSDVRDTISDTAQDPAYAFYPLVAYNDNLRLGAFGFPDQRLGRLSPCCRVCHLDATAQ